MRRALVVASIALALLAAAGVFAQQNLGLLGRYDDARFVDQNKQTTNQFVFTRLIYNGRIPGYIKNWYTDWPAADRQLIMGIQRLSNLNIADRERLIPLNDPDLFEYPFLYTERAGPDGVDALRCCDHAGVPRAGWLLGCG